jgi:hypothetical protein
VSKPPDRYEWSPLDEWPTHWLGAIALLVVFHLVWMIFIAWYVNLAEHGFLLGGCYEPGSKRDTGWISFSSGVCPPDRPYVDVLRWVVPIVGFLVSSLLPPIICRVPMDSFSDESERNFTAWLILCVLVPLVLGVIVIAWVVT